MTTSPGGQIEVAGKRVSRLGLGTMHLVGRGPWRAPADEESALELLQAAVRVHGITHIDTSDAYGPHVVEELIREALHPYSAELLTPQGSAWSARVGTNGPQWESRHAASTAQEAA